MALLALVLSGRVACESAPQCAQPSSPACIADQREADLSDLLQRSSRQHGLSAEGGRRENPFQQYLQGLVDTGKSNPMEGENECHLEDPDALGCKMCEMPHGESTFVFPGGKTQCILGDSAPFRFKVVPGDPEKLLFNFQGGGACLTKDTTTPAQNTMCIVDPVDISVAGIYTNSDPLNPYKDWTLVDVFYCSGDLFIGNATRDFLDNNMSVVQHGYWNAKSAVDWAVEQFPELDSLVITGSSAGCGAVMIWSNYILDQFEGKVKNKAVICDSMMGFMPPGVLENFLEELGPEDHCNLPVWTELARAACEEGVVPVGIMLPQTMELHPDAAVVMVNGKADPVMLTFYNVLAKEFNESTWSESQYVLHMNRRLSMWDEFPNFASYIINEDWHVFLPMPMCNTTDTSNTNGTEEEQALCEPHGPSSHVECPVSGVSCSGNQCCPSAQGLLKGKTFPCPSAEETFEGCETHVKAKSCLEPRLPLMEWLSQLPLYEGNLVTSACGGKLMSRKDWDQEGAGTRHCAAEHAGKVLKIEKDDA
mmetsp:Transcript_53364/g.135370  ORF Transcript_53364/g.135370 Transcript_53364/m.135370 type:complete len:536 (+) Transcript_53364:2-1609(+)